MHFIRGTLILSIYRRTLLKLDWAYRVSPPQLNEGIRSMLPNDKALSWFCLRSQAKREHVAATNLRERVGVEVFAPRIRAKRRTRAGIVVTMTEALFPGYLFARFSYPEQVRHVMSTSGVIGIVAFGGQPPAIADNVIDCLCREVAEAENTPIAPVIEQGAWVRILSGCFQYIEGQILDFDPRTERVRLLLTLLGSEVPVTVPIERVSLIEVSRTNYPSGLMTRPVVAESRVRSVV